MISKLNKRTASLIKLLHLKFIAHQQRQKFQQIEKYCMFVGYPRSGHTLISCLLNAHPDIVISNELDALGLLDKVNREQLFANILLQEKIFHKKKYEWSGYSYHVSGQSQGKFLNLRVIGDKKGGRSSRRFYLNEKLLPALIDTVKLPIFMIHVVRNPFDIIARRSIARSLTVQKCIEDFKIHSAACNKLRHNDNLNWFDLYHEDFVHEPSKHLRKLCDFLEVSSKEDYINDCASIVFSSPKKSRNKVKWSHEDIASVLQEISNYPSLQRYSFEE